MNTLAHDIRYGIRVLRKSPAFTLIAILALGLGIGANTALFSLVYGVLLRPLPYAQGNRLVALHQRAPKLGIDDTSFSVKEIEDYRAQSHTIQHLEEYHSMYFILLGREPDRVRTGVVSAGFFDLLGIKPLLGRSFMPADDHTGAPPVLILSYNYWQQHEGGDAKIIGTKYKMNDRLHTVVGVLPPIPQFPNADDVYMPTSACPFRSSDSHKLNRDMRMMDLFGRLAPGAHLENAEAEVRTVAGRLQQTYPASYPSNSGFTAGVESVHHELTSRARPMLS